MIISSSPYERFQYSAASAIVESKTNGGARPDLSARCEETIDITECAFTVSEYLAYSSQRHRTFIQGVTTMGYRYTRRLVCS